MRAQDTAAQLIHPHRHSTVDVLVHYQMDQFGYSEETAREEVVANTIPAILNDESYVKKLVEADRTLAERIRDFLQEFIDTIKETLRTLEGEASWKQMQSIRQDTELLSAIADMFDAALGETSSERGKAKEGVMLSTRERAGFARDRYYDRQIQRWDDLTDGARIKVGEVKLGSALNAVGLHDTGMYFDVGKIKKVMREHGDHLTENIMQQIPDLLSNPIVITQYSENTISVYGDLFVGNTPVVVGVVMNRGANGQTLINKIRTIHARKDFASQITDHNVLYLNEDKKRTRSWFQVCGIHVPLDGNKFGLIRSIRDSGENSNRAALGETHGNRNDLEADMKYSVNPTFEREYDAWDGKNENARFFVGKTSQTLRYIGVKNQEIVWDASKIIKVKRDHPAMTDEIIKQVPSVIEDPIIVMESKTVPGRITMFGELADADGAPVLVALELEPTKDHRLNMEVIKIASAYGKDTSPQKLLDESRVLFVDPNKNRTQTWLKLYKLQLPSSAKYGLNGRVTYKNASVNPSIRKNVQENAKDGGGARFSIRDNMTEAERFDELKDAELSVATYDADASKLTRAEVARLENATRREARQYVKTLYEKFGLGEKRYENPSVKIEFDFPYKGFSKSVHEQAARGNEYGSFGEMLACFDKIVENAIPLEIHTDKYVGTKREDSDLFGICI